MKRHSRGFTLIELLIVVLIAASLASIAIFYSNTSRNQVALSVESTKISELILQAKQLSIATYNGGSKPACAYGVYFDISSSTYSLFIYNPGGGNGAGVSQCPSLASTSASVFNPAADMIEYSGDSWNQSVGSGLNLEQDTSNCTSTVVVLFYPPNPTTLISNIDDGGTFSNQSAFVDIATDDGSAVEHIEITPAGQVSY